MSRLASAMIASLRAVSMAVCNSVLASSRCPAASSRSASWIRARASASWARTTPASPSARSEALAFVSSASRSNATRAS
jgi:hypothetical protein